MSIVIVLIALLVIAAVVYSVHSAFKLNFTAPKITEQEVYDDLNSHVESMDVLSPESIPPPAVIEAITAKEKQKVKKTKTTPKQKSTEPTEAKAKPKAKVKKLDA
jgi:hypothetical protein